MKSGEKIKIMKNLITLFLTLFVASGVGVAQKYSSYNGIRYKLDPENNTLSVLSNHYSGDIVIPSTLFSSTVYETSTIVMGGAKSANGAFYTCDNGVQSRTHLGDDAQNVIFCFDFRNTLDNFRFIS